LVRVVVAMVATTLPAHLALQTLVEVVEVGVMTHPVQKQAATAAAAS